MEKMGFVSTIVEIRQGSLKYVEAILNVMDDLREKNEIKNVKDMGMELICLAYAVGVTAIKYSDIGIEGFTLLLNGINLSIRGEHRTEKLQYALWDKDGNLHTSEEGFRFQEGGEQ